MSPDQPKPSEEPTKPPTSDESDNRNLADLIVNPRPLVPKRPGEAGGSTLRRIDPRAIGMGILAPLLAIVVAVAVTSFILLLSQDPIGGVWKTILNWPAPRVLAAILNAATVLYLSAVAAAIGFRMNLFNIGVDGQYRLASFAAAYVAGLGLFPGVLNILVALVVAMAAGAAAAAMAAWLKVYRGVSEVISTIMLNGIINSLVAFLLNRYRDRGGDQASIHTKIIPESSQLAGFDLIPGSRRKVYTMILLAVLVGFLYWFILNKTRFGYDLRATGRSESAAVASGVNVKRMVIMAMILSGAVAGLVGMPLLFGQDFQYGTTVQAGLGFAGIGVALLGRNHFLGMAFAAILWAFLDAQSNALQIQVGVSNQLVKVIQGVIVLSVVIAYEIVRRFNVKLEQRRVAVALGRVPAKETVSA